VAPTRLPRSWRMGVPRRSLASRAYVGRRRRSASSAAERCDQRTYKNGDQFYVSTASSARRSFAYRYVSMFTTSLQSSINVCGFYDATSKAFAWLTPTWQGAVSRDRRRLVIATSLRRMSVAAPAKMRAGDHVVVVIGIARRHHAAVASNATLDVRQPRGVGGGSRTFREYMRRRALDAEPSSYTFDLAASDARGVAVRARSIATPTTQPRSSRRSPTTSSMRRIGHVRNERRRALAICFSGSSCRSAQLAR
jgi:hypothetical protein